MKRMLLVLTAAAMMAVMLVASSTAAFANPLGPGTNSDRFQGGGHGDRNFGHCQSQQATAPGSPETFAQEENPAIFTKGQTSGSATQCPS